MPCYILLNLFINAAMLLWSHKTMMGCQMWVWFLSEFHLIRRLFIKHLCAAKYINVLRQLTKSHVYQSKLQIMITFFHDYKLFFDKISLSGANYLQLTLFPSLIIILSPELITALASRLHPYELIRCQIHDIVIFYYFTCTRQVLLSTDQHFSSKTASGMWYP